MKPLVEINTASKICHFSGQLYDILDQIDKRVNLWFVEKHIDKCKYICDENVNSDLDYMFSKGIWIIEMAESFGYTSGMTSIEFFESHYERYTTDGFKALISDKRYNRKDESVYTDAQVKENDERANKLALEILTELK